MKVCITQDDIDRFTSGDCHILAQQIHKKTGWPLYVFNPSPDDEFYGKYGDFHAFVKHPSGKYLDVEGLHTPRELKNKWGCDRVLKLSLKRMQEAWPSASFGQWSYLRAEQIARFLVSK